MKDEADKLLSDTINNYETTLQSIKLSFSEETDFLYESLSAMTSQATNLKNVNYFLTNNMKQFKQNYQQNVQNMQVEIQDLQQQIDVYESQIKALQKEKSRESQKLIQIKLKNDELQDKIKFVQHADRLKESSLNYFQRKYNNVDIDSMHQRIRELETDIDLKDSAFEKLKLDI